MKTLVVVFVAITLCAFAQDDAVTAKAIEGAKLLHQGMRDPDSFKLGRVWIMRSEKYGGSICYDYFARNGYGGMNNAQAIYSPIPNKRNRNYGKYLLTADPEQGFQVSLRCNDHANKHDLFVKDVTKEVNEALSSAE